MAPEWWGQLRHWLSEFHRVRPLYDGDFFPLTDFTLSSFDWIGWQLHRGDIGHGMLQLFRRGNSSLASTTVPIFGLQPAARYNVTGWGGVGTAGVVESGQTLRSGLAVSLPPPPAGCKNNDFNPNKTAGWTYRPRAAVAPRHTAAAAVQIDRLQAPVALR